MLFYKVISNYNYIEIRDNFSFLTKKKKKYEVIKQSE
jgi:hypothetical protein